MKQNIKFYEKDIVLFFKLLFIAQIAILIFFNFFQLQYHMGYDASSYFDAAVEMWNQKSFVLKNYEYQTSLYLDSPVPLAAIFYGVLQNIVLSYGISNIFFIGVMLLLSKKIMQQLDFKKWIIWFCLDLILVPYLPLDYFNANSLEYFNMLFVDMGAYLVKIVIFLCLIELGVLFIRSEIRFTLFEIITALLGAFIAGFSGGYLLLVLGLMPMLLYMVFVFFQKSGYTKRQQKIFFLVCMCAVTLIIGRLFSQQLLGFSSKDLTMTWVYLGDLWDNFISVFLGFIGLLNGVPSLENVPLLSLRGVSYGINFLMVLFFISTISVLFFKKEKKTPFQISGGIFLLVHLSIFTLADLTYGQPIFEKRYLIFSYIIAVFLIGSWLNRRKETKYLSFVLTSVFCLMCISTVMGDYVYFNTKNNFNELQAINQIVSGYDNKIVYIYGDDHEVDARNLRILGREVNHQYKFIYSNLCIHHWGDTLKNDDAGENDYGSILLTTQEQFEQLPNYISAWYKEAQVDLGIYKLFVSEDNPFDYKSGLPDVEMARSIDYPYSPGVCLIDNFYYNDQGMCVLENKDNVNTFVLWGPYSEVKQGRYSIKLNYESLNKATKKIGFFDIAINGEQKAMKEISAAETSVIIENISINDIKGKFEYRINLNAKEKIYVRSIELIHQDK